MLLLLICLQNVFYGLVGCVMIIRFISWILKIILEYNQFIVIEILFNISLLVLLIGLIIVVIVKYRNISLYIGDILRLPSNLMVLKSALLQLNILKVKWFLHVKFSYYLVGITLAFYKCLTYGILNFIG